MANPYASEVALVIDGTRHDLKLTLGALAELETHLKAETLLELVTRFESGAFSARDVLLLIAAGLKGAGADYEPARLAEAEIEGGPMAAARAAALLLARAFALPSEGQDAAV